MDISLNNPRRDYVSSGHRDGSESQRALPNAVKYSQLRPQAVEGESQQTIFPSVNATEFNPETNPIIDIKVSCGKGGFLDCANGYLDLTLDGNGSAVATQKLDGGLWSVIDKLELVSGSGVVIETISNYNLLHNKLFQYNTSPAHLVNHNVVSCSAMNLKQTANGVADGNPLDLPTESYYKPDECGLTGNNTLTGSFSLVSGFLNGQKYVPLGFSQAGFTIRLTLAKPRACMSGGAAAGDAVSYKVQQVRYIAPVIYIRDAAFHQNWDTMMAQVGGITWEGQTYRNLVGSIDANNGPTTRKININEQAKSLNGYMCVIRSQDLVNDAQVPSLSRSSIKEVSKYHYQVADKNFPNSDIPVASHADSNPLAVAGRGQYAGNQNSRAYQEVMKLFGTANDHNAGTLIGLNQFSVIEAREGAGVLAIDLETYNGDGNTSEHGINTAKTAMLSSLELEIDTGAVNRRLDIFAFKTGLFHLDMAGQFSSSM